MERTREELVAVRWWTFARVIEKSGSSLRCLSNIGIDLVKALGTLSHEYLPGDALSRGSEIDM
jgi:hypothetical protein